MKMIYLSLAFILGFFACSSPGTKTKKQDAVLIKDTIASTAANNSEELVDSLTPYPEDNLTVPPYGLDTVKALIDKIKFVDDPDGGDVEQKRLTQNCIWGYRLMKNSPIT